RLVADYVRHLGGDPSWYRGAVPAHLFPQWGFPLLARTLRAIPYDLRKVLNGGCRIELHRPLPANEPLALEACLETIDDNGSRAVIQNHLVTGTRSAPHAVDAWMYAVVPLKRGDGKKERPTVPLDARELGWWSISAADAVDFAVLTGDFNPVHWLRPYARAAGFRRTILHGFATLGRAIEALNRNRFAGDVSRLAVIDVKFVRPVLLPADVGLYLVPSASGPAGGSLYVGAGPGAPAVLTGTFEERTDG
ncbi:MAG: MaoC/PaaZ C-terminal domain-containing protein, partial [Myxococcota bacterium]